LGGRAVDSILHWPGDKDLYKEKYEFDSNGRIIQRLRAEDVDSSWVNTSRETYKYDSKGNMISFIEEVVDILDGWKLVFYWRSSYAYDSNGNMITNLGEVWKDSSWVNESKSSYIYDSKGNLIDFLREKWDGLNWVNICAVPIFM